MVATFFPEAFSFNSKLKVKGVGQFKEQVWDISYAALII